MRSHLVQSSRPLRSIEGGFCIAIPDRELPKSGGGTSAVFCTTGSDFSGIVETGVAARQARLQKPAPNTNLLYPRAIVPQLIGSHEPGTTTLSCAVLASPDLDMARRAWRTPPA